MITTLTPLDPGFSAGVVTPTVTSQPSSIEVYEGQTATFTVAATGGGLSYQWQKSDNAGVDWSNISGATSSSYTTAATVRTTDNDDQFRCVVTNSAGTVNSDAATLTVWSPAALTGLQLWLDASDASTIFEDTADLAEDNDSVRIWADKSGNTRDASQSTVANRPVYRAGEQNSRGVIEFDGADDFFTAGAIGNWNFLHNGSDGLAIIVAKPGVTANPDVAYALIDTGAAASADIGYTLSYDDRSSISRNNTIACNVSRAVGGAQAVFSATNDAISANTFSIIENKIDANNATALNRSISCINGGDPLANNALTNTPSASNSTYTLQIGRVATGGGLSYMNGQFAEIIICNDFNAASASKYRAYLAWKWGITLA